ncbi:MAG: SUMF1/EgtB/PvdO family nonheme iron enzyme [Dinghuibacter sp.]|nr:SUMF1/EgtB/PvdO family nonheme iron enzyme [Dinghuibacter sp.]
MFIVFVNGLTAQKNPPPGTLRLNDSVYIDKHPVTNADYAFFLLCLEQFWNHAVSDSLNQTDLSRLELPKLQRKYIRDMRWRNNQQLLYNRMQPGKAVYKFLDSGLTLKQQLLHPRVKDFPITGISLEQAVTFCKWRTDMVRIQYAANHKSEKKKAKHFSYLQYRLPLAGEWMAIQKEKGFLGKQLMNTRLQEEWKLQERFINYAFSFTEWVEPSGEIHKLAVNDQEKILDMTVPPSENTPMLMGFRCSCDVR